MITKTEWLKQTPKRKIDEIILKLLNKELSKISLPDLKKAARVSLLNFYNRQYRELSQINGYKLLLLLACIKIADKDTKLVEMSVSRAETIIKEYAPLVEPDVLISEDEINSFGVPLQKFSKDYIDKDVKPIFKRLSQQYPFDPDDYRGKDPKKAKYHHVNSLRNRAEMEARYNGHLENIKELAEQGNKLVIASTHNDCSERCREWQGRVFSLDGTSGTTDDGRKYVPLEEATDVWYQTKAGKWYKNGLLGFNCRHYLVPYKKGFRFTKASASKEEHEYDITKQQRYLERKVRYWRTEALTHKGVNAEEYEKARKKAEKANETYIAFSKANKRAYYPDRTKLI